MRAVHAWARGCMCSLHMAHSLAGLDLRVWFDVSSVHRPRPAKASHASCLHGIVAWACRNPHMGLWENAIHGTPKAHRLLAWDCMQCIQYMVHPNAVRSSGLFKGTCVRGCVS